jgi:hypothetical protein
MAYRAVGSVVRVHVLLLLLLRLRVSECVSECVSGTAPQALPT